MEVRYVIVYHKIVVEEDIPNLSRIWKVKIRAAIESKLTSHPEVYGRPLRRSLKGYRKLRVGDYRVVFRTTGSVVLILAILHRSVVYKLMEKRAI